MFKNMKVAILLALVLTTTMLFAGCNTTEDAKGNESTSQEVEKVIRVGTGGTYNPWCFKENDKLQGFEVDVWNEIGKRAGYKIEFTVSKFSGLVGLLDAGQIDTVAHQMSITKERQEKYNFTEPYAYSKYDFIVKKDSN
ncbi:MAG: transporter substrate-binding domain-containing protein [Tepidibacter sp.]|jgi:putative amino-acid transport system substrate-binding protein|uniref:transporter substrate-binding domain-containing protein n=1 Tax=Tepidibacter sp. TaxID=2529387 RepID=UPI0025EE0ADC|nr:transporter substrate-binding domain-containing protein [Tepidibacter sp.]MCT4509055.1 transporter substrate-binding domain-containing protein [Tepidibacter sp.]